MFVDTITFPVNHLPTLPLPKLRPYKTPFDFCWAESCCQRAPVMRPTHARNLWHGYPGGHPSTVTLSDIGGVSQTVAANA